MLNNATSENIRPYYPYTSETYTNLSRYTNGHPASPETKFAWSAYFKADMLQAKLDDIGTGFLRCDSM